MKKLLLFSFLIFGLISQGQTIYSENFVGQNGKGATGGGSVSIDLSNVDWTIDVSNAQLTATTDWFRVENERFEGRDLDGSGAIWFSPIIDISSFTNVSAQLDATSQGGMETSDQFITEYQLDSGAWTEFTTDGNLNDDFNSATPLVNSLNGSSLQLRVTMTNGAGSEIHSLDNVMVTGLSAGGNPPPVITNISNSPMSPTSADVVTVTADVTDNNLLNSVQIEYGFSTGVYDQTPISMSSTTGDTYTGDILAQSDGTEVFYRIVATDNDPMPETTASPEQSYMVLNPVITNFVAIQDFDMSLPVWSILLNEGDVNAAYGRTLDGTRISNGDVFELNDFNTGGLQDLELTIHNASVGGIENADQLEVYVNINGNGYPISPDITIQESDTSDNFFNASWTYDAVNGNIATTNAGIPATFNGDDDNGYSVIKINIPDNTNTVAVRIIANTNNNSEYFYIDDITLSGVSSGVEFIYNGTSWTPNAPSDVTNASTTSDNITVQSGSVALLGDINVRTLTVENMATLDLGSNIVNLARNLNAIGTANIVADEAVLNISGTIAQQINANLSLEDLLLNNANGATLNSPLSIEGLLQLTNGTLTTNNNLTLKSIAGKTAIVSPVVSGSVSGDVTVEQFYSDKRAFRFLGSTVNMTGSIYDNWQQGGLNSGDTNYIAGNGTHITGGTFADGFDQSGTNAVSMFTFTNNATPQEWVDFSSANSKATKTTSLMAGEPVRLFLRGDRSVSLTASGAQTPTETTLSSTGTLFAGTFDVTDLSQVEGGFNFIANPFQAQVNFSTLFNDSETNDILGAYYAWDPTIGDRGAYVTYTISTGTNNVMGSAVNEFIQPGQAFFTATVEDGATAGLAPVFKFKESFKSISSNTTNVFRNSNEFITTSVFRNDELASGKARDGVIISFDSNGSNQINSLDVIKLSNPDENLSVETSGVSLSVTQRTIPVHTEVIELKLNGLTGLNYTFNINNAFSSLQTIFIDSYLGTETVLSSGVNTLSVSFDSNTPASLDANRFSFRFENDVLTINDSAFAKAVRIFPNPYSGSELTIDNLITGEAVSINFFNMLGQKVYSFENSTSTGTETLINTTMLKSGIYLIKVSQGRLSASVKVIKQ